MMRHTLLRFLSPRTFRTFLFILFSSLLIVSGILSCMGGGAAPGGGSAPGDIGSGGNYGAPPISIPAPEALNMSAVTISEPSNGAVTVTGSNGAACSNCQVQGWNAGPVPAAWYRPLKNLLESDAYAATNFTVNANIAGAFTGQLDAAVGDLVCVRNVRSGIPGPALCRNVTNSTTTTGGTPPPPAASPPPPPPPGGGTIKSSITVDPSGNVFIIKGSTSKKKWDWMSLFINNAYAAGGEDAITTPGMTESVMIAPAVEYNVAACPGCGSEAMIKPDPLLNGKTCTIEKSRREGVPNSNDPNNPQLRLLPPEVVVSGLKYCDPNNVKLSHFQESGNSKIAIWSSNVLTIYNLSTKAVERQTAYWSTIAEFKFINPYRIVTFEDKEIQKSKIQDSLKKGLIDDLPALAVNETPFDIYWPVLRGIKSVNGLAGDGMGFAMTVTYSATRDKPEESCLIVGTTGEFEIDQLTKIESSCQKEPLTDLTFLGGGRIQTERGNALCGQNLVVLSPQTHQIIYHYLKREFAPAQCGGETEKKPISVPLSNNLVSLASNERNALTILDSAPEDAYFHTYRLESPGLEGRTERPEKFKIPYESRVKIEGSPTRVIWNQGIQAFITNAVSSEGTPTMTRITELRRLESPVNATNVELNPVPVVPGAAEEAPRPAIR